MGAFDEVHFDGDLENGAKLGLDLLCEDGSAFEDDPETAVISDAVKVLLQGLGEDFNREGLRKTPLRVAKALREGTRGYSQQVKDIVEGALFPEAGVHGGGSVGHAGGAGGLVVVRDIDLFSYCESCLLPFKVQCHVGYIPSGQRVVGLSKLSRVADVFAKRLQDPQRLAHQVCWALHNSIKPAGVAVALRCWHIQFPAEENSSTHNHYNNNNQVDDMRGWLPVSVCSSSGLFENRNNCDVWGDFLALVRFKLASTEMSTQCWCPSRSQEVSLCGGHGARNHHHLLNDFRISSAAKSGAAQPTMIAAATSILRSLGEDPLRKELMGTPQRFVRWLMNFKRLTNSEIGFDCGKLDLVRRRGSGGGGSHYGNGLGYELNLPFWSQCEHHLLPFHGVVHVACSFGEGEGEVGSVERCVLQSVVGFYGCKLQVQERLTRQIAETVSCVFGCSGVMVVVEANHVCMMSRGIEKVASNTATIAVLGGLATDPAAKSMFLQTVSERSTCSGR